jgi:hypothetical protein
LSVAASDTLFWVPQLKDTYRFEGSERNVSDELSTCGGDGETDSLVLGRVLGAHNCLVDIFEDLVEAELAETLSAVSDQGGEPALKLS